MTTQTTLSPGFAAEIKTKGGSALPDRYTMRSRYLFLTPEDEAAFLAKYPQYKNRSNSK